MGTKLCLYVKFNSIMFGLAHYPILIITEKHFYWMSCCFCDGVAPSCYGMATMTSQIFITVRVITFQHQLHIWGSYSNSFKQGNNTEVNHREISFEMLFFFFLSFFLSFFFVGGSCGRKLVQSTRACWSGKGPRAQLCCIFWSFALHALLPSVTSFIPTKCTQYVKYIHFSPITLYMFRFTLRYFLKNYMLFAILLHRFLYKM